MIGRNFIVKYSENFLEKNEKILPENFSSLPRKPKNTPKFSFSYDINDHVYF